MTYEHLWKLLEDIQLGTTLSPKISRSDESDLNMVNILQAPTGAEGWDEGTQLAPLRSDGAAHDRTCAAWEQVRTSDAKNTQ